MEDITRADLEELVSALESIRQDLASRLHAMTLEASDLWGRTHRQAGRIAELEAALPRSVGTAPIELAPLKPRVSNSRLPEQRARIEDLKAQLAEIDRQT